MDDGGNEQDVSGIEEAPFYLAQDVRAPAGQGVTTLCARLSESGPRRLVAVAMSPRERRLGAKDGRKADEAELN